MFMLNQENQVHASIVLHIFGGLHYLAIGTSRKGQKYKVSKWNISMPRKISAKELLMFFITKALTFRICQRAKKSLAEPSFTVWLCCRYQKKVNRERKIHQLMHSLTLFSTVPMKRTLVKVHVLEWRKSLQCIIMIALARLSRKLRVNQ